MVLRLHGYGAWIEVDGKPLEEYAVEIKDNVITGYVCSEEGKNFILRFDDDGSHYSGHAASYDYYGRAVDIKMDGSRVANRWGGFRREMSSDGMHVGDIVRPYTFAPIATTDDDDVAASDDAMNEHIGTIQADLRRCTELGPGTIGTGFNGTGPSTGPIHERSKKAGSHRVALGEGVYRRYSPVMVHYIDSVPWLTFRFLYRKRDMLKAQGILPQSPSPSPPGGSPGPSVKVEGLKGKGKGVKREREESGNDEVIEISDDDLGPLQDELKRIQDRIARKRARKSVKQEVAPSPDDIIDLT